jgi:hypothetical protein
MDERPLRRMTRGRAGLAPAWPGWGAVPLSRFGLRMGLNLSGMVLFFALERPGPA